MDIHNNRPSCRFFIDVFLVLLSSILIAALLIATKMDGKLFKIIMLGLFGLTVLVIVPCREKILLCLTAFLLPLEISINFLYEETWYKRPINGFVISAFDIPFFLLMLLWLHRLSYDYTLQVRLFPHITLPFCCIWLLALVGLYSLDTSLLIKVSVLFLMFKSWLVFIYLSNNIYNQETVLLLVGVLLLSGLLQSMIGIGEYINNGPLGLEILGECTGDLQKNQEGRARVCGTVGGHANKLALFLVTLLQLNMTYFFIRFPKQYRYMRWMYQLPLLPMLLTLLLSFSRGGWFSFLLGGILNGYWCMARRTGKKLLSAILIIGFFISFGTTMFVFVPPVRNRLLMDDDGAADVRKPTAEIARNIIYHHPLLGVGLNNYRSAIHKYDETDIGISYEWQAAVHNEFLLIAAEIGVPALIFFIYILAWLWFTLWRIAQSKSNSIFPYLAIGFFCGLISWSMQNQKEYQYVFFTTRFWYHIGIMMAIKSLTEEQAYDQRFL